MCIKLIPEQTTSSKEYELLRAFKKINKSYFDSNSKLIALTGTLQKLKDGDVSIYPWESIA